MPILETDRLQLDELCDDDAAFIHALLNEPPFLRFIGDRGVRTVEDARAWIRDSPGASYRRNGYGLYRVSLTGTGEPIGICGLVRRDSLPGPDIGFAFREVHWGRGYAGEAAAAVLSHARGSLAIDRVLAIVQPDNERSIRVLGRLGLRFDHAARIGDGKETLNVFTTG